MPSTDKNTDKPFFHPAFGVSSIKNYVVIVLELDNVQYDIWAELFLNTAKAFEVHHLLVDPADSDPAPSTADKALWARLDTIVKQWLYATISDDLLQTVVESGPTVKQTWDRIKALFNDNKNSRAILLEQQFSTTHMDNFPTVSSYFQALKRLADQLKNVGSPVSDDRLVIHMVTNLSPGYDNIVAFIQQCDPLPLFIKAQSMLALEETRQAKAHSPSNAVAMVNTHHSADADSVLAAHATQSSPRHTAGHGRGNHRTQSAHGRGRGGGPRPSNSA
ncbi:hypothetical protein vseg_021720 [Gypsophila vaccaria]